MPRAAKRVIRFVHALLRTGRAARSADGQYRLAGPGGTGALSAAEFATLASAGVVKELDGVCVPTAEASSWLRRQLADTDPHASQHRDLAVDREGRSVNLAESPLARLASRGAGDSAPFLAPNQVEAGERVRRLVERAQLSPRLTMSYNPAHTADGAGRAGAGDISDLAADARKALAGIYDALPRDCADVVLDVCGLLKGLQAVESERGWPRRSAKLVLRIGLEQAARHFGLDPVATGASARRSSNWMAGQRPELFG